MSFKDKFNAKKALAESKGFIPEAMKFQQKQRKKFGDDGDVEDLMSKSKRESSFNFIGEGDQSAGNDDDARVDELLTYKQDYIDKHGSSDGGTDAEWAAYQKGLAEINAKYKE